MKYFATILLFLSLCLECAAQWRMKLTDVGMGFAATSVNTAIFRQSAITTCRDTQFVAFYDPDGFLTLGKRALDADGSGVGDFILQKSQYKIQKIHDAHNVISIAADGDGYLHVAFDSHNSPLKYCRSVAPYSLTLGELETMLYKSKEKDVSYPAFYNFSDGDLLFVYRNVNALVMHRYFLREKRWWCIVDNILENNEHLRPYWQIAIDQKDVVHLSWLWRDYERDVNTNHGIYYACTNNCGYTWETYDGKRVKPVFTRQNTVPVVNIPPRSNLINQTSIAVDAHGRPYIATFYRQDSITNYHLIYYDGNRFNDMIVGGRTTDFAMRGIGTLKLPIARPLVICDGRMIYYITRDQQEGSLPAMYCAEINDGQQPVFDCINLTSEPLEAWEPLLDHALWREKRAIHILLQKTFQLDHDILAGHPPTMIKVLELQR